MAELIRIRSLTKFFPGIKALDRVDMTIRAGEVHALIGENGAGKSTLVKILTGVYIPTDGEIEIEGRKVSFRNALDAQDAGIVAIHQEASMFPELSVVENIFMGHHLRSRKTGLVDWKAMRRSTRELLGRLDLQIGPDTLVKNLSTAQRHMVEIAKALSLNAKCVIMDEPTSALTRNEVDDLYRIVRQLKAEGKAIVFISHKFDEIFDISDYFTVLRDGRYIGEGRISETSPDKIIHMMIGRDLATMYPEIPPFDPSSPVVLKVRNLTQNGAFRDVSFDLHKGEILGFYGLVGAGRSEVVRTIFGIDKADGGTMELRGKPYKPRGPVDAMEANLALVPEDRQKQGLILQLSISHNITLPVLAKLARKGFTQKAKERKFTMDHGEALEIKAAGWNVDADTLSGGNQQKVVLAKWIGTEPDILIMDEPTKGIDVATKASVHEFMAELARQGKSVVIISSELPEVIGMSNRIVVLHEGVQMGIFSGDRITSDNIMMAAIGEKVV